MNASNFYDETHPSSAPFRFKKTIFFLLVLNVLSYVWLFLHPEISNLFKRDKFKEIQGHLEIRLQSLRKKTEGIDALKKEHQVLSEHLKSLENLQKTRIPWSVLFQEFVLFTQDRPLWLSHFKVKAQESVESLKSQGKASVPVRSFLLECNLFSSGKNIDIPNSYRQDLEKTKWIQDYFDIKTLNNPSYTVLPLSEKDYKDVFCQQFLLKIQSKSTEALLNKKP
jgi:hypothetical protein